jgi:DNA (cytosine-5)-methyltransferase 1
VEIRVRMLGRFDDLLEKGTADLSPIDYPQHVKDDRRLYVTQETRVILPANIEGICRVEHKDDIADLDFFKDQADYFYVDQITRKELDCENMRPLGTNEHKVCKACTAKFKRQLGDICAFVQHIQASNQKLRAMDIFSGCGGITVGMDQTGVVDTRWAIEFDSSAAMTFKRNHPNAIAYNQCANLLLQRAIEQHDGKDSEVLQDFQEKDVPAMPAPGDVDFIYCGPPW